MKTAKEWFKTLGTPIMAGPGIRRHPHYEGFRAFNEYDIAEIQRDALKAAADLAALYIEQLKPGYIAGYIEMGINNLIEKTLDANAPKS